MSVQFTHEALIGNDSEAKRFGDGFISRSLVGSTPTAVTDMTCPADQASGFLNQMAKVRLPHRLLFSTKENVMLRGTRMLTGQEARQYVEATNTLRGYLHS